jgi:hypothetical protein
MKEAGFIPGSQEFHLSLKKYKIIVLVHSGETGIPVKCKFNFLVIKFLTRDGFCPFILWRRKGSGCCHYQK